MYKPGGQERNVYTYELSITGASPLGYTATSPLLETADVYSPQRIGNTAQESIKVEQLLPDEEVLLAYQNHPRYKISWQLNSKDISSPLNTATTYNAFIREGSDDTQINCDPEDIGTGRFECIIYGNTQSAQKETLVIKTNNGLLGLSDGETKTLTPQKFPSASLKYTYPGLKFTITPSLGRSISNLIKSNIADVLDEQFEYDLCYISTAINGADVSWGTNETDWNDPHCVSNGYPDSENQSTENTDTDLELKWEANADSPNSGDGVWTAQKEASLTMQYMFRLSAKTKLYPEQTSIYTTGKITTDNRPTESGAIRISQHNNTITVVQDPFISQSGAAITHYKAQFCEANAACDAEASWRSIDAIIGANNISAMFDIAPTAAEATGEKLAPNTQYKFRIVVYVQDTASIAAYGTPGEFTTAGNFAIAQIGDVQQTGADKLEFGFKIPASYIGDDHDSLTISTPVVSGGTVMCKVGSGGTFTADSLSVHAGDAVECEATGLAAGVHNITVNASGEYNNTGTLELSGTIHRAKAPTGVVVDAQTETASATNTSNQNSV
jgi:hypothetical protein